MSRADLASYVGERIREAMRRVGMVHEDGKPNVMALAKAVGCRWQTAQGWVDGRQVPTARYAKAVAGALGMTLAELVGAATGEAPRYPAWTRFLASPIGATATPGELEALAAMVWPHGEPSETSYAIALTALRASK